MAVALVNTNSNTGSGSSASIALSAQSHTTGNTLVVGVRSAGWRQVTVTDTAGNFYSCCGSSVNFGGSEHLTLFVARNIAGNANNVITAAFADVNGSSSAVSFRYIVSAQYSGLGSIPTLNIASAIGNRTVSSNTLTAPTISSLGTTGVFVTVSQIAASGTTWTPGSGFSFVVQDADNTVYMQDMTFTSLQSSVSPSVTSSSGTSKDILAIVLAEVSDGSGGGGSGTGESGCVS